MVLVQEKANKEDLAIYTLVRWSQIFLFLHKLSRNLCPVPHNPILRLKNATSQIQGPRIWSLTVARYLTMEPITSNQARKKLYCQRNPQKDPQCPPEIIIKLPEHLIHVKQHSKHFADTHSLFTCSLILRGSVINIPYIWRDRCTKSLRNLPTFLESRKASYWNAGILTPKFLLLTQITYCLSDGAKENSKQGIDSQREVLGQPA